MVRKMISQSKNRVQAIKSKFENLQVEKEPLVSKKKLEKHLNKQCDSTDDENKNKENLFKNTFDSISSEEIIAKPNSSFLFDKSDVKHNINDIKKTLSRQSSDPGKKLHRSHAFRCDRTQKLVSPKRHDSCKGRPETGDFMVRPEDRKLSNERLKKLGRYIDQQICEGATTSMDVTDNNERCIEQQISSELATASMEDTDNSEEQIPFISIPDVNVPRHILDQYAKVLKPKKNSSEQMTDSGVSSETENLEDDKSKKLDMCETNLELMDDEVCASTETMRLERKNPHVKLTDTLKKALKQPLPMGPPPKKPPRTFETPEKKKDAKKMLEKLEQVLLKREAKKVNKNIYDIAETDLSETVELNTTAVEKPKEVHYLCTEILDITQRTLLPNQTDSADVIKSCFNSLNCAVVPNKSTTSLPYSRLSQSLSGTNLNQFCSCSSDNLERPRLSTFFKETPCHKCRINESKCDSFKCHINCNCKEHNSQFFVQKQDNIYDVPFGGKKNYMTDGVKLKSRLSEGSYGFVNGATNRIVSKSMEDLKHHCEEEKIYDIPSEVSRPPTPDIIQSASRSEFERLRRNFETNDKMTDENKMAEQNKMAAKPAVKPKPMVKMPSDSKIKMASTDSISQEFKTARQNIEKKFATETKKYRKNERREQSVSSIAAKKERKDQLDLDRENLNRLMSEIYETVSAACKMDEPKPTKFPTDGASTTSEDSVKLTRSLTEKRKNYVRRVSSRVAYIDARTKNKYRHQTSVCSYKSDILDANYSTFRSWKSFKNSQQNLNSQQTNKSNMEVSKFNLTDSDGNLLSLRDEFDCSIDNVSVDDKTGCLDLELPFESDKRLFDVCLLVGLNYMDGQAYVKSVFPSEVKVPPHIENLVFPETMSLNLDQNSKLDYDLNAEKTQNYSLVLTDERGERRYGYCRRVLPEGACVCLPLCYCIIGRYRAPGFYYKVLKEIESHHGSSEVEINTILQQLYETDFPSPGEEITIKYDVRIHQELVKNNYRKSCNLGDILKSKTLPARRSDVNGRQEKDQNKLKGIMGTEKDQNGTIHDHTLKKDGDVEKQQIRNGLQNDRVGLDKDLFGPNKDQIPDFYDLENNNRPRTVIFVESERVKVVKRPLEPRVDENNLCVLLDTLGAGLCIKVFSSLLLERKVVIVSDNLSRLSSCMEGLQSILYPFVWQQPLISTIPSELRREILEAPLPILAGLLRRTDDAIEEGLMFEEGMLIDVTSTPKVIYFQGDESTILPTNSYKTLKTTLQMESNKNQNRTEDEKTRNVLISEAFLRFFVDSLGGFWDCYSIGVLDDGQLGKGDVVFNKEAFVKKASSKQTQFFLEWFTETAMFNHFVQNMAACYKRRKEIYPQAIDYTTIEGIVDAPLPNFYEIFDQRLSRKQNGHKIVDSTKTTYKSAVNKKVKMLKNKLRDLVT